MRGVRGGEGRRGRHRRRFRCHRHRLRLPPSPGPFPHVSPLLHQVLQNWVGHVPYSLRMRPKNPLASLPLRRGLRHRVLGARVARVRVWTFLRRFHTLTPLQRRVRIGRAGAPRGRREESREQSRRREQSRCHVQRGAASPSPRPSFPPGCPFYSQNVCGPTLYFLSTGWAEDGPCSLVRVTTIGPTDQS